MLLNCCKISSFVFKLNLRLHTKSMKTCDSMLTSGFALGTQFMVKTVLHEHTVTKVKGQKLRDYNKKMKFDVQVSLSLNFHTNTARSTRCAFIPSLLKATADVMYVQLVRTNKVYTFLTKEGCSCPISYRKSVLVLFP